MVLSPNFLKATSNTTKQTDPVGLCSLMQNVCRGIGISDDYDKYEKKANLL